MNQRDIKNRSPENPGFPVKEPVIALNTRFHDMGGFVSSVDWDLEFRQLDRGRLNADLIGIMGQDCLLLGVDFNRSFHQMGAAPDGMFTFAVPYLETPEIKWCSGTAQGGSLISFNLEHNYDAVTPAYAAVTVSIQSKRLRFLAEEMGLHWNLERVFRSCNHWHNGRSISLARKLQTLLKDAKSVRVPMRAYSGFLNDDLPREILTVLLDGVSRSPVISDEYKYRVLRRALEVINDPERMPIKVNDLCAIAECSPATLRRVFVSEIGISPKTYLRNRCLSAVRDALARSPENGSITEIANEWGFWHMGQFAKDYRAMFGELPSITLKRH